MNCLLNFQLETFFLGVFSRSPGGDSRRFSERTRTPTRRTGRGRTALYFTNSRAFDDALVHDLRTKSQNPRTTVKKYEWKPNPLGWCPGASSSIVPRRRLIETLITWWQSLSRPLWTQCNYSTDKTMRVNYNKSDLYNETTIIAEWRAPRTRIPSTYSLLSAYLILALLLP